MKSVPIALRAPEKPNEGGKKTILLSPLKGKNLIPLDRNLITQPLSDPYIKFFFKNQMSMTEVQERTLNPVFETGRLNLGELDPNDTNVIEIQYWDYDIVLSDDCGGVARFSVAGLLAATEGRSGPVSTLVVSFH